MGAAGVSSGPQDMQVFYQCPTCCECWDNLWDGYCDDDCGTCGERAIMAIAYAPVDAEGNAEEIVSLR